jgi:cellulose synthase/poly-beta-1,6-N-acetylglucosamine synthase-like glycosyltransferase
VLGTEDVTAGTGPPLVSVIIPVRDRRALLRQALDALAAQTWTDYEVIVVDDDSADGSGEEAKADASAGRPVRVIKTDGRGAVAARRAGVKAALGEYLAFTDSDCVPDPDWLLRGVDALNAGADLVQGLTRPHGDFRAMARTMWVLKEDGLYPTCNVFYRRSAYEAAGGFDTAAGDRFGFRPGSMLRGLGFGEDALLGWAVKRSGLAVFVPEAIVEHEVFAVDVRDSVRRAWATGGFPALVREVPEFRTFLTDGIFLGRRSRAPLYLAAAALAVGRHRLAALPLLAWIGIRAAEVARLEPSSTRRLKVLPVDLLLDATKAASLIGGSIRTRTVVL